MGLQRIRCSKLEVFFFILLTNCLEQVFSWQILSQVDAQLTLMAKLICKARFVSKLEPLYARYWPGEAPRNATNRQSGLVGLAGPLDIIPGRKRFVPKAKQLQIMLFIYSHTAFLKPTKLKAHPRPRHFSRR